MKLNVQLGSVLDQIEKGTTTCDRSFFIKNITSFEKAGPEDLVVIIDRGDKSVFDNISVDKIKRSSAGLFLASKPVVEGKNYLIVEDVLAAFNKIINSRNEGAKIHPSATIEKSSKIGANCFIGAQVVVGNNCTIGNNVTLHPGCTILDGSIIGDNSIIHSGTVIGSDGFGYQVTEQGLNKIPQIGIVRIGRHVEVGANCSIDRASFDETIIEDLVKIDNNVHIAHNVHIGAGSAILAQTGIAGSSIIGRGCQIGGQVAIRDNIKIGNNVKIVSKSAVMNNIEDNSTIAGIPAISFSTWKRLTVYASKLPDLFKAVRDAQKLFTQKQQSKKWFWRLFR